MNTHSEKAPKPLGPYPHSKRVGDLLFLSGIGPRDANSPDIPGVTLDGSGNVISYDIEAQCHSVFKNIKTVLEDSGSSWDALVDVTVFLTNMEDDFPVYNELYKQYFGEVMPCRTTVGVSALPAPIAIELKCVAYLGHR